MTGELTYLKHQEIDKERWDTCIRNAPAGRIYAYSFYLDKMAGPWDALVWKDYETVMPLTWKQQYGIRYICQPFLAAQLGLMGSSVNAALLQAILEAIPRRFRLIDISLNAANLYNIPGFPFRNRLNLVLPLEAGYPTLQSGYNENIRRNLRKAAQAGLQVQKGIPVSEVIRLATAQMRALGQETTDNIRRFRELFPVLEAKGMTATYGVFREEILLSSAVFFFSHRRAYYILVGNNPAGRDTGASHALIDAFIRDHAGQELILDFEGSDIPTLAAFYQSFGALPEPYPALRVNRLPFWLKWLKS